MSDSRVDEIIRRQEKMATDRAIFDSHWREIAERILPRADHFRVNRNPGDKHTERVFDATANLALERFAAAMESMLTPRTQKWQRPGAQAVRWNRRHTPRASHRASASR